MKKQKHITTKEFAMLIHSNVSKVKRLIKEGTVIATKINPRCYMIAESEVDKYLKNQ